MDPANRVACSLCLLMLCAPTASVHAADRLMPFLSRDAILREPDARVLLAGAGHAPEIVLGSDMPGPRSDFENSKMAQAANVLALYLGKITGAQCPIVDAPTQSASAGTVARILVGAAGDPLQAFPELTDVDGHGFVIAHRDDGLHIVGRSGAATLYCAWFFLQNYTGLRLVGPAEIGEVCQPVERLEIPEGLYVLNPGPDYLLRIWSGPSGMDLAAWMGDDGGTQRFEYHHNMWRIFDPAQFGETHPEYYPVLRGERFIPSPTVRNGWQPTYSEPACVQRAIEYADEAFSARPELMSISLTLNDGGGWSELDEQAAGGKQAAYWRFVNQVAAAVKQRWPGKFVAFLSYADAQQPPDFPLEDNLMLFLFSYTGNPQEPYAAWEGHVRHLGVYQWLYGMGWIMPNHMPHATQEYLQWIRARGGAAFKGEGYVAWAIDGPRMWVVNNLLWNADADVDALLDDYYLHAYGPEAAPAMGRYWAQAEAICERRRTPEQFNLTRWKPGNYQLQFATQDDFDAMAAALTEARRLVQGEANATRVDMTARCFHQTELFWRQYQASLAFAELPAADAEPRLAAAGDWWAAKRAIDAWRETQIAPLAGWTVQAPRNAEDYGIWWLADPRTNWGEFPAQVTATVEARTAELLAAGTREQAAAYWERLARERPELAPFAQEQRLKLLHPDAPLRNLAANGSFEAPPDLDDATQAQLLEDLRGERVIWWDANACEYPGSVARDWFSFTKRVAGVEVRLDGTQATDGGASLTALGRGQQAGAIQDLRLPTNQGRYRISFMYRTSGPDVRAMTGWLLYRVKELAGETPVLPGATEWTRWEATVTVNYPDKVDTRLTIAALLLDGKQPTDQVWFDDVRLELLSPAGLEGLAGP